MSFLEHLHQLLYVTIIANVSATKGILQDVLEGDAVVEDTFWLHSHLLCREGATGANIHMYAYLSPLNQLLYQIHSNLFCHLSLPYYLIQCCLV